MTHPIDDFLPERRPSNTVYLSIYEGKLCQRRATETPGFTEYVSRSPKTKGKVSWIREFDHINGYVTAFEKREKETLEKKKFWVAQVTIQHPTGRVAIIETPIKSEFVARFALCFENMDLTKPLWIRSFLDRDGNTAVMFKQDNALVAQRYTKENPNGLPAWRKDPISGEWDTRDYWAFLFKIISEKAIPKMASVKAALDGLREDDLGTPPSEATYQPAAPPTDESDDDIPF